jgi:16S rRNA (uracil1498-N3)-methyltransferase
MQPRLLRWRKIAREAAMQSGRTIDARGGRAADLCRRMTTELEKHRQALVPWEEATAKSLPEAYDGSRDIAVVIGPEGGMEPDEITQMKATPVTLGPRILRAETAGVVAIAALLAVAGDMRYTTPEK